MSQSEFTTAVEHELHLRGVGFSRADLLEFTAAVWSLAEDDPDPARWAQAFIDTGRATVTV